MPGRRSHRPRKSIDYSKLSSEKEDADQDDDDFIKTTPKKCKEREKPRDSQGSASEKNKTAPTERRARNRLSEEEKYNKQLEEALKLSIIDASKSGDTEKSSNKDVNNSQHDLCVPLTVRVEVMDSPTSKQRRNMEKSETMPNVPNCVKNGAILPVSDRITPVPTKDITAKPLKSRRSRTAVTKQEDDDYQFSGESESNEDDDETFEDFQDASPVKKRKRTTSAKSSVNKEIEATSKTSVVIKNTLKSGKSTPASNSSEISSVARSVCPKTAPSASPMTPKSINVLSVKSPSLLPKKFIQRGWTPPGPAGIKASTLKSSPSPSCIRVGLSRNARISPLHPRTIIR